MVSISPPYSEEAPL